MRKIAIILGCVSLFAQPAFATASPDNMVVTGVPDGGLAAASLVARDFQVAARNLAAPRPDAANDPARLINLGNAYVGLNQMANAREAYRSARFAPDTILVLANSEEASSRDIAVRALRRLEGRYDKH